MGSLSNFLLNDIIKYEARGVEKIGIRGDILWMVPNYKCKKKFHQEVIYIPKYNYVFFNQKETECSEKKTYFSRCYYSIDNTS